MTKKEIKDLAFAIVLIALGLGLLTYKSSFSPKKKWDTTGYAPREESYEDFWEKQLERERDEVGIIPAGSVRGPLARGQGEYISRETREKERQKALKREELAIKIETGIAVGLLCSMLLSLAMAKWYAKQEKAEWEELSHGSISKEFNTKKEALKAYYRGEEGKEKLAEFTETEQNFPEAVCQEILEYTDEVVYEREEDGLEAVCAGCKHYINATDLEKLVDAHCSLPISFPFEGKLAEKYKQKDAERTRILAGYWKQNHTDKEFCEKAAFYRVVFYKGKYELQKILPIGISEWKIKEELSERLSIQFEYIFTYEFINDADYNSFMRHVPLWMILSNQYSSAEKIGKENFPNDRPIFIFSLRGREEIESFISGARPAWSPKSVTIDMVKQAFWEEGGVLFTLWMLVLPIVFYVHQEDKAIEYKYNSESKLKEFFSSLEGLAFIPLFFGVFLGAGKVLLAIRGLLLIVRSALCMLTFPEGLLFYASDMRSMFCVALIGFVGLKELILFIILSNLLTWGMKKLEISKWLLGLDREEENSAFCLLFLPLSLGVIAMLIVTLAFNSFPYPALIGFATALLALALGQFWGSYLTFVRNTISSTSEVKRSLFFFSPNDKRAFLLFIWICNYVLFSFLFQGVSVGVVE